MLKIREEQYEELGNISLKRFEDSMVEHIKEFFPENYEALGEPVVRNVIEYGVNRAEAHGFDTEPDVNMYIDLMFMLGSNFDTDPQLPWAAEILKNKSMEDEPEEDETEEDETRSEPVRKIEKLYDQAIEFLDRIEGTEDEYLEKALDEFGEITLEDLPLTGSDDIENKTVAFLQRIWPEKCQAIGPYALNSLIICGTESAKQYKISNPRGIVFYILLMFFLGSAFDTDPQFPWAASALKEESTINEAARIDRLYKEAMAFLDKWLVES